MRSVRPRLASVLVSSLALLALPAAQATDAQSDSALGGGAVVLKYHRFAERRHPSTNIRLEQFDAHIAELSSPAYKVLPLPAVIDALAEGSPLPERVVVLTIDDAWRSAFEHAWPRLRRAGLPFTVFVIAEPLDGRFPAYMSWDQVRELDANGVTIGAKSSSHRNLATLSDGEIRAELRRTQDSFRRALGRPAEFLAYPYGVYSRRIQALAREAGFRAAVADHSGVAHGGSDPMALPRFAMSEARGDLKRLRLAAGALPFPVSDLEPADVDLTGHPNPPEVRFNPASGLGPTNALACYLGDGTSLTLRRDQDGGIGIVFPGALPRGRSRMNCTLPGPDGRWRWLGRMFYVPGP